MGDACGMKLFCHILLSVLGILAVSAVSVVAAEGAGKGFPIGTPASGVTQSAPVSLAAPAEPAAPAVVGAGAYENQPINFAANTSRRRSQDGEREFVMPSIWPALLAVGGVCALFCAGLYLAKKYLPGHRQLFTHPAMEVLGRTHLDQRRYVSLLRVGKRILVVGVSPDDMRPLSEITDETEVTGILEVARPKTESGLTVFQRLFQRTVVDAEAAETRAMADEKAKQLDAAMSNLRRRVEEIKGKGAKETAKKPDAEKRRRVDAIG